MYSYQSTPDDVRDASHDGETETFYDIARDNITALYDDVSSFTQQLKIPGTEIAGNVLNAFKAKIDAWHSKYMELKTDNSPLTPDIQARKARLLASGETIMKIVNGMGITAKSGTLDGLNALPLVLIGGAAATGVLALIAKWYYDSKQVFAQIDLAKSLSAQGKSGDEIARILANVTATSSTTMKTSTKLILGAVVIGGLYLYFRSTRNGRYE